MQEIQTIIDNIDIIIKFHDITRSLYKSKQFKTIVIRYINANMNYNLSLESYQIQYEFDFQVTDKSVIVKIYNDTDDELAYEIPFDIFLKEENIAAYEKTMKAKYELLNNKKSLAFHKAELKKINDNAEKIKQYIAKLETEISRCE